MEEIYIEWFAEDINILNNFSDNYNLPLNFDFEEETEDIIRDVFIRFYSTDKKSTLDEAKKWHLKTIFWDLHCNWKEYWYSECTIMWFNITNANLWWHNIQDIIDSNKWKYLHIIISQKDK